ncbi:hypothetical protein [Amycolatopsis echigonensis]|uniref:hypothetical protein n=1 Tax=Amycolatopsis echigonensis TaxID=2576905 RepID=UPI001304F29A|nr:hypothetical protein [Amycolatopsis niigatensis]
MAGFSVVEVLTRVSATVPVVVVADRHMRQGIHRCPQREVALNQLGHVAEVDVVAEKNA